MSYNPLRGDEMSNELRTEVRIAYDDRNIYFAFHCFDNEPDKIRTTISRRDTAFNDDWIAMSLDSAGTGQTAYHLFVNPSGSQMDALNTSASGEQFDADLVWYSAGRCTADGYIVEVEVPLQTLRFSSGDEVRMGIMFFRKISRMGVLVLVARHAGGAMGVRQPRARALQQPDAAAAGGAAAKRHLRRQPDARRRRSVERGRRRRELGLSGKFGITSNVTVDGTINPDFSQVESDAFQVEVNQRFPIFFSEKRPFFMEGMGLFNIAGTGGDGNMRTAVHTRRIIDPLWGTKLTGTAGRTTFGVLNASMTRQKTSQSGDAIDNTLFTIARATYALRGPDYHRRHRHRHGAGGPPQPRRRRRSVAEVLSAPQQLTATFLSVADRRSARAVRRSGTGSHVATATTRGASCGRTRSSTTAPRFQMDTAFYNRTGFHRGMVVRRGQLLSEGGHRLLAAAGPSVLPRQSVDTTRSRTATKSFLNTGIRFNFTRQGYFEIIAQPGTRTVARPAIQERAGHRRSTATVQILRWLQLNAVVNTAQRHLLRPGDPFQGRSQNAHRSA